MKWISDNWSKLALVAGVLLAIVLYVLTRDPKVLEAARTKKAREFKRIDKKAEVRRVVAKQGKDAAVRQIRTEFAEQIAKAKDEDKAKVEELANDPEALVDFMLSITMPR